ncbi:MAG: type II secretion system protein [Dehalococcoidia bacterium]
MTKLKVQIKPQKPLLGRCAEPSSFVVARSTATKQSGAERGQEIATHLPHLSLRGPFFVCYCEEASSPVVARSTATKQSGAERGQEIAAHPAGARNDRMRNHEKMKRIRLSNKTRKTLGGSSRGFTLIEMLIALALFAIIAIVFAGGLSTASRAVLTADVRTRAESLARTQMESVKNEDYIDYSESGHGNYAVIEEDLYILQVVVEPLNPETYEPYNEEGGVFEEDDGIQEITVTVSHDDRQVITLVGYKVDRE